MPVFPMRTALLAGILTAATCMGEKPNALRADAGTTTAPAGKLKITGLTNDRLEARLYRIVGGKTAEFTTTLPDGSRQTVNVEPWPDSVPQCAPSECGLIVQRIDNPDGPEMRLTVSRKGSVVALVAVQGRLRNLPGGLPLQSVIPSGRKPSGGRLGVDLRVGGQLLERGKSTEIQWENRSCRMHLYDASIAGESRPGIAEESAAFMADWVLSCK